MSQFTPIAKSGLSHLRTGFERVIAHRTKLPFAYPAEQDGVVKDINEELGLITLSYKDGKTYTLKYGEEYSRNGGGGFYVTQRIALNNLAIGRKFKRGDVLLYNKDYFTADPYSTQVDMNLGYFTNVALVEMGLTMEDSSIITKETAQAIESLPVQIRTITIKNGSTVHSFAKEGTEVKSTQPLMVFDDSMLPEEYTDTALIESLSKLNRATPKAKYNGTVVRVEIFHKAPFEKLSKSVQNLVNHLGKRDNALAKHAAGSENANDFFPSGPVVGDRVGSDKIDDETVIVKFYIQQALSFNAGDKLVFAGSLKSVCGKVLDENLPTGPDGKSPTKVGAILAAASVGNRMVLSVSILGTVGRILEKAEADLCDIVLGD